MIEGFIEVIRPFQIRGWAFDPASPKMPVTVSLIVAGEEIAVESAALFRRDLRDGGIGDGHHSFVFNIDRKLPVTAPQQIEVHARSADGQSRILPQTANAVVEDVVQPVTEVAELSPIKGYFAVKSSMISGWAFYPQQPDEHLAVDVIADGHRIASGVADEFRPDLVLAFIGNGDHGFVLDTARLPFADGHAKIDVIARSESGISGALRPIDSDAGIAPPPTTTPRFVEPTIVFREATADPAQHPVFILGAARSGTSALAQALVSATRYAGQEEGHLLDLIAPMLQLVARHYDEQSEEWTKRSNTMISLVPRQYLEDGVRHTFVELARALFPDGWWMDKTPRPSMIPAAPLLQEIWPEARFIFMKRRAVENIASRMRKFPGVSFENHCRDWTTSMQSWAAVREHVAGSAMEIDQLFLATQPHQAAAALGPFLRLTSQEVAALAQTLATDRPERTAENFGAITSLAALGLSDEQVETFHRVCGPMMAAYGYNVGPEYIG